MMFNETMFPSKLTMLFCSVTSSMILLAKCTAILAKCFTLKRTAISIRLCF